MGAEDVAHYTQTGGLVEAMIYGNEVVALCGWRFVPMRDPAGREVCPTCLAIVGREGEAWQRK